ncbi:MAG: hypothetical protein K0R84_678, partial [Clostridia bacterium]|nr:hypothetical protein [Clostridia bacterium]
FSWYYTIFNYIIKQLYSDFLLIVTYNLNIGIYKDKLLIFEVQI